MKTILLVIISTLLLLTSCNYPLQATGHEQEQIETRVAETMAAFAGNTATLAVPGSATSTTQPLEVLNTLAPDITPTLTATATATISPDDPVLSLGTPDFFDTFSNGMAFALPYEDDESLVKVDNGAMVLMTKTTYAGTRWRLTSRNPRNLYLEGRFKTVNCLGEDSYGIVFRAPSYTEGTGYFFGINCEGSYFFQKWISLDTYTLVNQTLSPAILLGNGQTNRVGVRAENNTFKFYINGTYIAEFSDSAIPAGGYIGAFLSAYETPGYMVNLEEISLWSLP